MTAPVSIVIPILNEAETLPELLGGLERQSLLPQEIIFVDAGSTDGGPDLIQKWWKSKAWSGGECRVLSRPGAFPGAGRNAGIEVARSAWIAFLDGGITPEPDWLASLLRFAEANRVPSVFGMCRFWGEGAFWRALCALSYGQGVLRPVLPASLFRKEVFKEVGLFPEDLLAAEDVVWVARHFAAYGRKDVCRDALVQYRYFPETWGRALRKWYVYSVNVAKSGSFPRRQAGYIAGFALVVTGVAVNPWAVLSLFPLYVVARGVLDPMRRSTPRRWWGETKRAVVVALGLGVTLDAAKTAGFIAGNVLRAARWGRGSG
jgi:glycosyltransferase involved in cell wall biosynthesis